MEAITNLSWRTEVDNGKISHRVALSGHHVLKEFSELGDWLGLFDDQEAGLQVVFSLHIHRVQLTGQPSGRENGIDLVVEQSSELAAFAQLFGQLLSHIL